MSTDVHGRRLFWRLFYAPFWGELDLAAISKEGFNALLLPAPIKSKPRFESIAVEAKIHGIDLILSGSKSIDLESRSPLYLHLDQEVIPVSPSGSLLPGASMTLQKKMPLDHQIWSPKTPLILDVHDLDLDNPAPMAVVGHSHAIVKKPKSLKITFETEPADNGKVTEIFMPFHSYLEGYEILYSDGMIEKDLARSRLFYWHSQNQRVHTLILMSRRKTLRGRVMNHLIQKSIKTNWG